MVHDLGAAPRTVFCSSALLWGPGGLSYYAIFQELLDPACCFSSCPLPWRGPWSGPGVSSSPFRGGPSGGGQVPLAATLPPTSLAPPPPGITSVQTPGSPADPSPGPHTWKTPFSAEYLRCRLESLPGLKLSSVRVHPGESRHPHL